MTAALPGLYTRDKGSCRHVRGVEADPEMCAMRGIELRVDLGPTPGLRQPNLTDPMILVTASPEIARKAATHTRSPALVAQHRTQHQSIIATGPDLALKGRARERQWDIVGPQNVFQTLCDSQGLARLPVETGRRLFVKKRAIVVVQQEALDNTTKHADIIIKGVEQTNITAGSDSTLCAVK